MFDANMSYLPKDKMFFALISYIDPDTCSPELSRMVTSDVLLCRMMEPSKSSTRWETPAVVTYVGKDKDGEVFHGILSSDDGDYSHFVYEGNIDGTGFLDNSGGISSKNKARILLGGSF